MSAITSTLNTCATGTVCADQAGICVPGGTASCASTPLIPVTTTTTVATTTAPVWTATKYCQAKSDGRIPNPTDTTCDG